jgi:hypothetical protein
MGGSDPDFRKKVFGPRWQHEIEKQSWPLWKKLIHRLQHCPICRPNVGSRSKKSMSVIADFASQGGLNASNRFASASKVNEFCA